MFEAIFELFLLLPLAIICAALLAMGGFALFGAWGGGAGAVAGVALGLILEKSIGDRVNAAMIRRKLTGTMLIVAALLGMPVVAIATR